MKKRKDKSKMIIMIAICAILVGIFVIVKFAPKKEVVTNDANTDRAGLATGKDYKSDLALSGFGVFFDKFSGDLMSSEILSEVKKMVVKHIPKMYNIIKEYDENELEIFYQNNAKNLKSMFGIQDVDTFKHFAKGLQAQITDLNRYVRLDVIKETFVDESDISGYAYAEFEVTYEDGTVIPFSLYVSKDSKSSVVYMVDILD